jgi:TonB family protein
VPQAAMIMKGHVVITFNIHRNGAITDIEVKKPSPIESFNYAAVNALISSNPTQPLPAEYPSDSAFFTVTFLYNEDPADFR